MSIHRAGTYAPTDRCLPPDDMTETHSLMTLSVLMKVRKNNQTYLPRTVMVSTVRTADVKSGDKAAHRKPSLFHRNCVTGLNVLIHTGMSVSAFHCGQRTFCYEIPIVKSVSVLVWT